ncbi:MAG: nicotinate-nucleotide adenylyltransferase [Microthrixaceae bacterium]
MEKPVGDRRIGVFGGTFDPPHIGHLVMATEVYEALGLERILMVPAGEPWQKTSAGDVSPADARLAMIEAAVRDVDGLEVSTIEVDRSGPTYSVDTLRELAADAPDAELFLVLGADAAAGLDTWQDWQALPDLCRLVVVDRPGESESVPAGFDPLRVSAPRLDISSTDIRERVASGRAVRFLVPDDVIAVIEDLALYRARPLL